MIADQNAEVRVAVPARCSGHLHRGARLMMPFDGAQGRATHVPVEGTHPHRDLASSSHPGMAPVAVSHDERRSGACCLSRVWPSLEPRAS